jgi:hypothetical protein
MNIKDLLDRPIAFHRPLVTLTGSISAGLMLSQAIYWSKRTSDKDGWFYKTRKDWEEETGLTRTEQDTARQRLRALGFWQEERRDVPAKLYFRINEETLQSRLLESCNLEGRKPTAKMRQNQQSLSLSETTTQKSKATAASHPSSITSCGKVEKQTPQQKRFRLIGQLAKGAEEILGYHPGCSHGDLAEDLKQWAAERGLPYFDRWPDAASPIQQAITIATERRKSA